MSQPQGKPGYLALVLHAHLPFVRHPEHPKFLEESWLFEAVTETYLPLIQLMDGWLRDGMQFRLTLTLTPTLCSMLQDELLQDRYDQHLNSLVELAEKEVHRTTWDKACHPLARLYHERLVAARNTYLSYQRNLVEAFKRFQLSGCLEIITCAATHALLPLLGSHPESVRAQVLIARDHYRSCFGCDPRGIWLPECAYSEGIEHVLLEANIRWFIMDTHGLLHANPRPRYGVFAPIYTPNGIAAFGRDLDSAKQVWSRNEGYPGDPRYRDFYRDIGFDLDLDYLKPYLPSPELRGFTGIKYHRITGTGGAKEIYDRKAALAAVEEHATHFLEARVAQFQQLQGIMDRPPMILCPYDAELFGHWWYEGPEFLDLFMRKAYYDQQAFSLITPAEFIKERPSHQIAAPSPSSWGEEGYYRVWLNETNEWIIPHLEIAMDRMHELAVRYPNPTDVERRALNQTARELLLAQASDWPFILRTGTSPNYARQRVKDHLLRFIALHEQLTITRVDERWLAQVEATDNIFPEINYRYWA